MASYEQNKSSKLWSVRFRETVGGEVKNKRLSGFKTKREAQQAFIRYAEQARQNQRLAEAAEKESEELLFDDIYSKYMEYEKARVKESSFYDIQAKFKLITPYFHGKCMTSITPADIMDWQNSLSGYSYQYKSRLRTHLNSLFKFAYRYYNVPNIAEKAEGFRNTEPKKEMQVWTKDEFQMFYDSCHGLRDKAFFKLLYVTGCRKGEALALTWNDIDFEKRTMRINKNITTKTFDGTYKVTTPKNLSSNRTVDLTSSLCELLNEYQQTVKPKSDNEFVFGGDRPMPTTSVDHAFERAIARAGVKKIRIHDLRHSCASLLISEGVSIVAVSKRLGHSNIEQTLNTYSHMMPSDSERIIKILEDI